MIHTLKLKNFRKHREFEAAFTPGLNVIHGNNNSGKTTLLRAVRFACHEQGLSRQRCISTGAKEGQVLVILDEGTILREFGAKLDRTLVDDGEWNNPTRAVVDSAIRPHMKAYGLGPTPRADGESYPQFLDSGTLFMVRDTPTQLKRTISSLSFADVFEACRDVAKKRLGELRRDLSATEKQLAVESAELADGASLLARCEELGDKLRAAHVRADANSSTLTLLKGFRQRLREVELHTLPKGVESAAAAAIESVLTVRDAVIDLRRQRDDLRGFQRSKDEMERLVEQANAEVEAAERREREVREELLASGVCPLCGGPVDAAEHPAGEC